MLNIIFIRGLGPIPAFGTVGAAMGTVIAFGLVAIYSLVKLWGGGWVVSFPRHHGFAPDCAIIRSLFRFGLPSGVQGIAMNVGGVFMLSFIGSLAQSAAAQAAFAVVYAQLFSLITWTSDGLMGAAAAVAGQNLGAGKPERATAAVARRRAASGSAAQRSSGSSSSCSPASCSPCSGCTTRWWWGSATQLLRVLSVSRPVHHGGAHLLPAGSRARGTRGARSTSRSSRRWSSRSASAS